MNFKNKIVPNVLWLSAVLAFGASEVPAGYAETEDVRVLERKPDASNPMYEVVKVEGGLIFRAPKDMTFMKQDGVIAPISTEEYCVRKFEDIRKRIEALSDRIAQLEKHAGRESVKDSLTSL